ncbi:hypothetical protein [Rhizobium sp. CECT 9324]|uniref:hypothetical protein n=1 Tax=Rhizobium sp. CECT 9324 TaxID=2845820 RepID=UPI001E5530EA|nr:hypothetical protein [Rhizobium sp. CECT 9324]
MLEILDRQLAAALQRMVATLGFIDAAICSYIGHLLVTKAIMQTTDFEMSC